MALLFFCWLFLGLVRTAARLRSLVALPAVDRSRAVFAVAAFCGLIGFLAHGMVDFGWRLPANLFYAVTLLALVHGAAHEPARQAIAALAVKSSEEGRYGMPNR